MLPSEYWYKKEDGRYAPGHGNHDYHLVARPPGPVLGRDLDRTEPVDRDEQDCKLWHETDGVVDWQPEIAEDGTKLGRPVTNLEFLSVNILLKCGLNV